MAPVLPLLSVESKAVVADSYLVVFKDGIRAHDFTALASTQGFHARESSSSPSVSQFIFGGGRLSNVWNDIASGIKHVYDIGSFQGVAGHFRPDALHVIRASPAVAYIEHDTVGRLVNIKTQHNTTWGPARISRRHSLNVRQKDADAAVFDYMHDPRGGLNVTVFVIDTGINLEHKEFEGRAEWGVTTVAGGNDYDDHGHGTHCAGTVGSRSFGVSKSAHLVAVKVIGEDGHGTVSEFIAGVDFVIRRHLELKRLQGTNHRGSVATISLGYERSRAMDTVVRAAIEAGIHVAVAAGNDGSDYCEIQSPRVEGTFTVGASTIEDERATWSNYGPCVDIFAPGRTVLSTWIGNDTAIEIASGTSMATPHLAGLLAYYLALQPLSASGFNSGVLTPEELKHLVLSKGTRGVLSNVPSGTVNLLIYNGASEDSKYFYT
ncbi:serine protease [Linnemannia gamsii]|uniref:Serine protease n=1 Tax=Linnemannia gamsii TaxID=64522 RepID=A0A9P6UHS1_9FUNG|nr:serine protease [Linnemannia gamsii]